MPALEIRDFRAGIDRRRARAMTEPGALWDLRNAVINAGGEIERAPVLAQKFMLPQNAVDAAYARGEFYLFSSAAAPSTLPPGARWVRLEHPEKAPRMERVVDFDLFDGRFYVIADYSDGSTVHFYDGKVVPTIYAGSGRFAPTLGAVAERLATEISEGGWLATSATEPGGAVVLIEGAIGQAFAVEADTINRGSNADNRVAVRLVQSAAQPANAAAATATITVLNGATGLTLSSLSAGGVSLIPTPIAGTGEIFSTAQAIVDAVNAAPTQYSARRNGPTVIVSAPLSAGQGINDEIVEAAASAGMLTPTGVFRGGVTGQGGASQITAVALTGTFERQDLWRISVDGVAYGYIDGDAAAGRTCTTHDDKMYVASGSLVNFSAVGDPLRFGLKQIGAGFINFQTHWGGSEDVTALETLGKLLAIFSPQAIQLWATDPDPARYQRIETMQSTGALSGRTVAAYGGSDIFYLARQGIRSLQPRGDTELANVVEIGAPIDALVAEYLATLGPATIAAAQAGIEPSAQRYWLAVGRRAFVFCYSRASKISAWTVIDLPTRVERFIATQKTLCFLGEDRALYEIGGPSGLEIGDLPIRIETPLFGMSRPQNWKSWKAVDVVAPAGTWRVGVVTNPEREQWVDSQVQFVDGVTASRCEIPITGAGSHIGLLLECNTPGPARLASVMIHFDVQAE